MNRNDLDEQGQRTLWISWSRLQEWSKCQQKTVFHMEHKGSAIKEGRNFVSGTVADRAMRKWLEQDSEQLSGQMSTYVDELWDEYTVNSNEYKVTWKSPQDQVNAKELARECVNNLEPFLFARVIPFEYQPEWRFTLAVKVPDIVPNRLRTVVLNGGADIIVRNPETNAHFIYDLKTTRNESYVKGSTLAQLIYYQVALNLATGAPFETMHSAFLTPVCKAQYHPLNVTSEDRRLLMSRIVSMAQSIWRNDPPTLTADENECYFCDCKSICPRFGIPASQSKDGKHRASFSKAAELRKEAKERTE